MASESIPEKKLRRSFNDQKKSIVSFHNEQKSRVYDLFINTTSVSSHTATRTASVASTISNKAQAIGITAGRIVAMHGSPSEVDKNDVVSTLSKIKPNQGNWRADESLDTPSINTTKTK